MFSNLTIIFDWKGTLYNAESKSLIPGAVEILTFLKQKTISLILIGKGREDMHKEVERLGIKKYFTTIIFKEGAKDINLFAQFVKKDTPEATIVIGDRVQSEIAVGNSLGTMTIWIKQGKFANETPENEKQMPSYEVHSLLKLKNLLEKKL